MYDAIIVLGGSFVDKNTLPPWAEKRLDYAISQADNCRHIIVASRGTPHKPPPFDDTLQPVDECTIMASYLTEHGVASEKILMESWSRDTIGNAYGVLTQHCIPYNLASLLVVTSDFHMPRSKAIFEKVFSLVPFKKFDIAFYETDSELSISEKERQSTEKWRENSSRINTLADMHQFVFREHDLYRCGATTQRNTKYTKEEMEMYCV